VRGRGKLGERPAYWTPVGNEICWSLFEGVNDTGAGTAAAGNGGSASGSASAGELP
jgi:hypothetical protein